MFWVLSSSCKVLSVRDLSTELARILRGRGLHISAVISRPSKNFYNINSTHNKGC